MTRILTRYLSVTLLRHFVLFTLVVLFLASLIQFLENRDGLLNETELSVAEVARFSFLSAPEIFSLLAGFIALVSAVFACASLTRHSELKVMMVSGVSFGQFAAALIPAALIMAVFHFWMENSVLPRSAAELRDWGIGSFADDNLSGAEGVWVHQGDSILLAAPLRARDQSLSGTELFMLDEAGQLMGHIAAPIARFTGEGLLFDEAVLTIPGEPGTTPVRGFQFETSLDYETLVLLAQHPRHTSAWNLAGILAESGAAAHPRYVYVFWFHKKMSAPVTTALLVLTLAPLAPLFLRMSNIFHIVLIGLAGGFLFFVVDAVLAGMGTDGIVPPLLAAWAPTYLLILAMIFALLTQFRGRSTERA